MPSPNDRRYTDSHEWHKPDTGGKSVTLGITRFAIDELTDITYVKLPNIGDSVKAGTAMGEIESVKATSDLYSGVSGKVNAVNDAVVADPSIINADPYEKGWLIKVDAPSASTELSALHDSKSYDAKYPTH